MFKSTGVKRKAGGQGKEPGVSRRRTGLQEHWARKGLGFAGGKHFCAPTPPIKFAPATILGTTPQPMVRRLREWPKRIARLDRHWADQLGAHLMRVTRHHHLDVGAVSAVKAVICPSRRWCDGRTAAVASKEGVVWRQLPLFLSTYPHPRTWCGALDELALHSTCRARFLF